MVQTGNCILVGRRAAGAFYVAALLLTSLAFPSIALAQPDNSPLQLSKTIPLPGVQGKFDHFAIDLAGHRLFAAAAGNHSVEVIDLASGKVEQTIPGFGKPHGLAWIASTGSLYVSDGAQRELDRFEGAPLKPAGKIPLSDDADDMVLNEATHLLYVGHGGSDAANPARIAVVDVATFKLKANIAVATHPEGLDSDPHGDRVFANIADASEVAVIDGKSSSVAAHWKLNNAADNVPLAYDAADNILYLGARTPSNVIALDAATGTELSRAPTAGGADDLFYDPALHRVYVVCGAGEVDVYKAEPGKPLRSAGVLHTEAGAKTALFVPSQSLLYVGVPGVSGHAAEIRVYSTNATKGNQ